jgi:hypothetical protein
MNHCPHSHCSAATAWLPAGTSPAITTTDDSAGSPSSPRIFFPGEYP